MILSMTGFATTTVEIPVSQEHGIILSMSLKSLNSRFFELNCKIPSLLSNLEVPVQRVLQKKLHRGHVSLHIKIVNSELLDEAVKPATHMIQNYLTAINQIQQQFNLHDTVSLFQILQLPNVLQSQELQLNEEIETSIINAIALLADNMILTQQAEGLQLAHDIQNQIASMQLKITEIQKLSVQFIQEKKDLFDQIITKLATFEPVATADQKSTEQCLLETKKTTLMYEIEKIDINEETVRFTSHLANVDLQMAMTDPLKGKKLDFTIQELNREINTIASKCSHIGISSLAIDIKAALEKAREQAQNII